MPWTRDRKKTIRLAGFLSIPVFAGVALYLLREPIAQSTRSLRSQYSLRKAQASSEDADWENAFRQALVARQLNPKSVEPLRLLVGCAFNSRASRTLDYANALFLHPDATNADKLYVLSLIHQVQDYVGFVRLYNLLPKETRQEREFIILRARFLIARNAFDTAKEILEQGIGEVRDRQYLLLLASILVQPSSSEAEMARGQQIIAELAGSDDPDETARTAFQLLGFIEPGRLRPELLGNLGARALGKSPAATGEYLAAASFAIAAAKSPEEKRRIVDRAISEQGGLAPAQLAAWLQRVDPDADVLDFLTKERSSKHPDLFEMRLGALIRAGKLEEADQWLAEPPPGFGAINIWLARAQLSRVKEEKAAETNAWEQAFQIAQNTADNNEYLRIFDVASKANRPDLATRALLQAPSHPTGILPPAADTVGPMIYLAENDRLEDLRYLTEALVVREPENVHLLNNLIYLNFLLDRQIEASITSVEALIQERPDLLSLRTTHAMGLLVRGDTEAALATLPEDPALWTNASSPDRAIHATALKRAGRVAEAGAVWSQVVESELNKAERRILLDETDQSRGNNEAAETPAVPGAEDKSRGAEAADAATPEDR
jgi:hypothetical protein